MANIYDMPVQRITGEPATLGDYLGKLGKARVEQYACSFSTTSVKTRNTFPESLVLSKFATVQPRLNRSCSKPRFADITMPGSIIDGRPAPGYPLEEAGDDHPFRPPRAGVRIVTVFRMFSRIERTFAPSTCFIPSTAP
jgi:hypothetical protein